MSKYPSFVMAVAATVATISAFRSDGAVRYWTGAGGNGEWTNTLNWADSTMATGNDTAIFTNDVPLNLRLNYPDDYYGAKHFKFLGKDVIIESDNNDKSLFLYGDEIFSSVEVVEGTTVTFASRTDYASIYMYHGSSLGFEKLGGGTLRYVSNSGDKDQIVPVKWLSIRDGVFDAVLEESSAAAPYKITTSDARAANIYVATGAVFSASRYTAITPGSYDPCVVLDGGAIMMDLTNTPNWYILGDSTRHKPEIEIYESGGTITAKNRVGYNSDQVRARIYSPFKTESDLEEDGGVDGGVTFDLRDTGIKIMPLAPFSLKGPVTVRDGMLVLDHYGSTEYPDLATYPAFLGTGDFTLDSSVIAYDTDATGNLDTGTLLLASGAGSKMTVCGASAIRLRESTANNVQHIVIGPDGAATGASLARERGAALFLRDGGAEFDGSGSTLKVNGGVATNEATTLVKMPVFSENSTGGNGTLSFLCYDGDKGFYEFANYVAWLSAGENDVVGGKIWPSLAANTTKHIAAMQLGEWGNLTLNAGSCLTIGNGVDPACLLLSYKTDVFGTGTIDFRTSEGVIAIANMQLDDANNYGGHRIECNLTGSGGVSYVSLPGYGYRMASISGANDYTGDTHISVATILPRNELAFSSGDVYVEGGYRNGGKIAFDRPLTFANAFHVSGTGHRADMYSKNLFGYGALTFLTNDVVLTGTVELTEKTDVSAMPAGSCGTFAGAISGDKLCVCEGEGSIILAANNTYTGGTEVVSAKIALAGTSPSLGTGMVKLDDGIVLFKNTSPITFSNPVEGNGTFRVLGSAVTFTVPQIKGGSPTVATAGTRVEFANGVARIIHPHGMAIIFR